MTCVLLLPLGLGALLAACGDGAVPVRTSAEKPIRIIAAPAGPISAGAPQPSGYQWVLAGPPASRTLQRISLGGAAAAPPLPASSGATSVVQSSSSLLAVGIATIFTGALEIRNGASGAVIATVPIGAPVYDVTAGSDGATFYALNGTPTSETVSVVNAINDRIASNVPVPVDTVSIAVDPRQKWIFALEKGGQLKEISLPDHQVVASFAGGSSPVTMVMSGDGSTLFVLNGNGAVDDVEVLDVATERQLKALPAPANGVDLSLSLDGTQLYELAGTPAYGNIQVFSASR